MDFSWSAIHSYAAEAELWTSLIVNTWLIIVAISFVVENPKVALEPLAFQVARAIVWGYIGICYLAGGLLASLILHASTSILERMGGMATAIVIFGYLIYGGHALLKRLEKRKKPQQTDSGLD